MSQRYLGGVITANPTTPTMTTESGVWTLEQQFQYSNVWSPEIVGNSLRFRSSASAYLNRTSAASPTNTLKWSLSLWTKRGALGVQRSVIGANVSTAYTSLSFLAGDTLRVNYNNGTNAQLVTSQVFRDPSAWYHILLVSDSANATASSRILLYVNGLQVTSFSTATYPALNTASEWNYNSSAQTLGTAATEYFDGYMAEVYFVDGQALTPSSFGAFDSNGVWQPLAYTGTFGTNGFYVDFSDNSGTTSTTLGKDYSGNGNNWTPNNFSLTAGTTYDWMLDSPTNSDNGGTGRGNYAVVNPLFRNSSMISDGNLYFNKSTIGWATGQATMPLPAAKTYFEATATLIGGANSGVFIGIATASATQDSYQIANQWSFGGTGGTLKLYNQTTLVTPAGSSAAGDIFQVAYDGATGNLWFGKNNSWYDSAGGTTGNPSTGANPTMTLTAGTEVFPCAICYANGLKFTFGQQPFTYTPPTGFKALNTQNLPVANITNGAQYMAATLYTGNASTQTIYNSANNPIGTVFQPDFVWTKARSQAYWHNLYDSVRGINNSLASNVTNAQDTTTGTLTAFNSNGFSVGASDNGNYTNGATAVAWQWKAGGTAVSNTNGSITSSVSANTTAGFSVVTYTGTGSAATVGHGLGAAPKMIIIKARNSAQDWPVYHASIGNDKSVYLDLTNAQSGSSATIWNNTSPTSSVFSLGTIGALNGNTTTYVAYCWAEIAGYSKFGSYTGNGSADGPFVYCGFRPRYVLIKRTSTTGDWFIEDSARAPANVVDNYLFANASSAEGTSYPLVDFLSNGFKLRTTDAGVNGSGSTMIFAAFAENPFNISRAR